MKLELVQDSLLFLGLLCYSGRNYIFCCEPVCVCMGVDSNHGFSQQTSSAESDAPFRVTEGAGGGGEEQSQQHCSRDWFVLRSASPFCYSHTTPLPYSQKEQPPTERDGTPDLTATLVPACAGFKSSSIYICVCNQVSLPRSATSSGTTWSTPASVTLFQRYRLSVMSVILRTTHIYP